MANLGDLVKLDSTSTANILYVGQAKQGSATSDPVWTLFVYDTSGDGSKEYPTDAGIDIGKAVWDDRTSYTYG